MESEQNMSSEETAEKTQRVEDRKSQIPGRRRKIAAIIAAVLVVVGLVVGIPYYLHARAWESTDDAFIEGHIVQIGPKVSGQVAEVYVTDNQAVKAGDLLVEIDPRDYQARLDSAAANLNAAIAREKAATTNVELTRTTSDASVSQASSGVEMAQSGVETARAMLGAVRSKQVQAEAQVRAAEADAAQAQADVTVAQAEATRAETELGRIQTLAQSNSASPQELTNSTAASRSASAKLEAARKKALAAEAQVAQARAAQQSAAEDLNQAQAQLVESQAKVGQAKAVLESARSAPQQVSISQSQAQQAVASVAQARAAFQQAELNLAYTKIVAPESGRVTRKNVEPGAYVQVGQALMAIVPDNVWVVANFKETQLTRMQPGQPAEVHVDAYPGETIKGHVDSIQRGTGARFSLLPPENATGNYVKVVQRVPVKIVFDEKPSPNHPLGPGMSVVPDVKVR